MIRLKKRYVLPILGAIATVGARYLMKNKSQNENTSPITDSLVNAGMPDQLNNQDHSQLENAKMVSEGSQFGVQYFNETAQEGMDEVLEKISE